MKKNTIPEECLTAYDTLVDMFDEVDRKGKTVPYTSLNGHMFSFLSSDGSMALRLDKDDREKFCSDWKTEIRVEHGRVMKEYVTVPTALQRDPGKLKNTLNAVWTTFLL